MGFVSGNHLLLFVIFLVIVLVIFGPGKLPDVGAGMGRAIHEFRKASAEVRDGLVHSGEAAGATPPSSGSGVAPAAMVTPVPATATVGAASTTPDRGA